MREKIIETVVKECDSKNNDFPSKESDEGKKMIQTLKKETGLENDKEER